MGRIEEMKGILLAGGSGSRLYPITTGISKQLLPIYDKPMVYYPLSVLMLAGIRDILVISTPHDLPLFRRALGDGSRFGVQLSYAEQPEPRGIAEAFKIGASFIGDSPVCLILGDNILYGHNMVSHLSDGRTHVESHGGGLVFAYSVKDPERYGVVEFDPQFRAISIEEKPKAPKSPYAVVGLYFYDASVVGIVRELKPSARGELEITDVNRRYLAENRLAVQVLGRGYAWLDAGTPDSLQDASQYIQTIQSRQGLQIACLEEIAYRNGWISEAELAQLGATLGPNDYGQYVRGLVHVL